MAKKSKDHQANKGNKGNKENNGSSSTHPYDQKQGQQGEKFSNEIGKRPKGQENRLADAQNRQEINKAEDQVNQGIDLPEITTTKSGCLPKLFMILLPFIAAGTFLLFRS